MTHDEPFQLILENAGDGVLVLLVIGKMYAKQRSIWGILLPHFVLGNMLVAFGFI